MFDVVAFNDSDGCVAFRYETNVPTLLRAKLLRKIAADVIVYAGTNRIVPSSLWLWAWEQDNTDSYAYKLVQESKLREPAYLGLP